jgi:cGMP-dependent protein kinase
VVEAFTLVSYKDGETVITQGENGSTFYIVKDGTMLVTKDGEKVAVLSSGDYFGEQALLTDDARAATVVAEKGVECFVLDRCASTGLMYSNVARSRMCSTGILSLVCLGH